MISVKVAYLQEKHAHSQKHPAAGTSRILCQTTMSVTLFGLEHVPLQHISFKGTVSHLVAIYKHTVNYCAKHRILAIYYTVLGDATDV